jgi:uncharacterized membrane protein YvbJ
MNNQKYNQKKCPLENSDNKENFCGACIAAPLALASVGTSAYGATSRGSNKRMKKFLVWGGIISAIITLIVAYFYLKNCSDCK